MIAPQKQNPSGGRDFAKNVDLDGLQEKYTSSPHEIKPSRAAILHNWADFLVLISSMIARREPVSRAGQSCILHVSDLLRELAR